jgi:hypothetical protein
MRRLRRVSAQSSAAGFARSRPACRSTLLPLVAAAALALPALALPVAAAQQPAAPPTAERGATLRVYLMTVGQGNAIWELFGHNAIRILDQSTGFDAAYNYGVFDFDQPGYIGRLVEGEMRYWLEVYDGVWLFDRYVEANRSVWFQELNLTPAQRADMLEFLEWNALEANRYYRYDYYRDNCSTRVRDALDRVLGGQLRAILSARETGTTYRDHTQRLLASRIPESTGTLLAMGPRVDRPISAWEESFLPVRLMHHLRDVQVRAPDGALQPLVIGETAAFTASRAPELDRRPDRFVWYIGIGIGYGLLVLLLGLATGASRGRAAAGEAAGRYLFRRTVRASSAVAAVFALFAFAWALAAGAFGTIIAFVATLTSHTFTYYNENLLQANPLSLALAVVIPFAVAGRARRTAITLAVLTAALSFAGFVLQLLPAFDQANREMLGLAVPIHVALALGLGSALRRPSAR